MLIILLFAEITSSVLIGLTLAVTDEFKTLFVVIVFHRQFMFDNYPMISAHRQNTETFEGLGIGSRLAYLNLSERYRYVAIAGALLYGITTPLGIAVGLGVRTTYNPDSTKATIVSGILDCLSAGILIYTGLVEVLVPFCMSTFDY